MNKEEKEFLDSLEKQAKKDKKFLFDIFLLKTNSQTEEQITVNLADELIYAEQVKDMSADEANAFLANEYKDEYKNRRVRYINSEVILDFVKKATEEDTLQDSKIVNILYKELEARRRELNG